MDYTLRMRGIIVGRSALEARDPARRVARGPFRPALGYELLQPVFRLHADAVTDEGEVRDPERLARYEAARERLAFELVDAAGRAVRIGRVLIVDRTEERGPSALELEVASDDPAFWEERAH